MVADWRLTLHFIWATNSATACAVTENTHRNQLWNLPLNLTVFVLNEVKLCWFMWSSLSSLLLACCFQIFVSERKKAISGTTGFPAHYREFRIDSWIGICVHTCVFFAMCSLRKPTSSVVFVQLWDLFTFDGGLPTNLIFWRHKWKWSLPLKTKMNKTFLYDGQNTERTSN